MMELIKLGMKNIIKTGRSLLQHQLSKKGHLENEKDLSFIANEIEILEENK